MWLFVYICTCIWLYIKYMYAHGIYTNVCMYMYVCMYVMVVFVLYP